MLNEIPKSLNLLVNATAYEAVLRKTAHPDLTMYDVYRCGFKFGGFCIACLELELIKVPKLTFVRWEFAKWAQRCERDLRAQGGG